MSLIAYWCGYTWDISKNEVRHLQDLATAYELESYNSQYGATLKPQQINLKTTYMMETGTPDINWVIDAWMAGIGTRGPLYVGGKQFGNNDMQLTKVDVSNLLVDDFGRLRRVTIGLNFTENKESQMISTVSSTSSTTTTATNIGASSADKASNKTYSIPFESKEKLNHVLLKKMQSNTN